MILNINDEQQECIVAGLQMQRLYIQTSIDQINKRIQEGFLDSNRTMIPRLTMRATSIDILLTKLNVKQDSESKIIKG